jgi:hypothetical protein
VVIQFVSVFIRLCLFTFSYVIIFALVSTLYKKLLYSVLKCVTQFLQGVYSPLLKVLALCIRFYYILVVALCVKKIF